MYFVPDHVVWAAERVKCVRMLATLLVAIGLSSFWFWVFLQYTPLWFEMVMGYNVLLGPEAPMLQESEERAIAKRNLDKLKFQFRTSRKHKASAVIRRDIM